MAICTHQCKQSLIQEKLRMKYLTVRQPWAWLLVNGHKDIENRSWPTKYRGPLLIHAAQQKAVG